MWHKFKHRVVAWFTVWLDISDNILYIITFGSVKTHMGVQFRLFVINFLIDKTTDKLERGRK